MAKDSITHVADHVSKLGLLPRWNECLSLHTTLGIGGPAELLVECHSKEDMISLHQTALSHEIPVFVVGGGSNLLVRDGGMPGLVILDRNRGYTIEGNLVRLCSGEPLADVVMKLARQGLGGTEFLAGIPGTVAGAVVGNAGAYGQDISSILTSIKVLRNGCIIDLSPAALAYTYRNSSIKANGLQGMTRDIVLEATIQINPSPERDPYLEVRKILEHRSSRLPPPQVGCAGSWFKNLPPEREGEPRQAAGKFLDQAGCKILSCGDARVYSGHANIIINQGRASAADVTTLALAMAEAVRHRFGIELQAEVMTVGRQLMTSHD